MQDDEVTSSSIVKPVLPLEVHNTLHQAISLDEISQYCVLPDKQDQLDFIMCDPPETRGTLDPELPLSGKSSLLQTIFSVRASGKPSYLSVQVPVPTHWGLDLLENLLEDYEDELVVDYVRYGWPMSRSILPLTKVSAQVNHKGAIDFHEAINQYLATEHSSNTLLGPFCAQSFPDRTASSPPQLSTQM